MPSSKALPTREANLFKTVVRLYEGKNIKKAVKTAERILEKHPDHGETLAMKGLCLNALDRKVEALELVKKGLRLHMNSHICWHVYGLLYRSDRDYREAAKAYVNALKFDSENQQILRDLSLLQIQIRDYEGLEETRRKLLSIRSSFKNNWIGFALAFHLLGNHSTAISVIDTYQEMPKGADDREDTYETSELLLYKNLILEEAGHFEEALKHLDDNEDRIMDLLGLRENRARLLSRLGRHKECAEQLRELMRFNVDNVAYHRGLMNTAVLAARAERGEVNDDDMLPIESGMLTKEHLRKRLSVDVRIRGKADVEAALAALDDLVEQFPRNRLSPRIALDILPSGDHPQFLARLDKYVRPFIFKGVPSLFSDLKNLYGDKTKSASAGRLFENYKESLVSAVGALPPRLVLDENDAHCDEKEEKGAADKKPEDLLVWVYHYLAQHYDRIGSRRRALEAVEKALELDPKAAEIYVVKARILKHCGNLSNAVEVMDQVRRMEVSDRYLNTKCTKYALRNDMVAQAEAWIGLFTRDGDHGGPQALYEMQSMWFELESAESHLRCGEMSKALKKFTAVDRHFGDMVEDQFDFHSYCLRKVTLRSYVCLLRFEDRIRSHPYYARAAAGMIRVLLLIVDLPESEQNAHSSEHRDILGFAQMNEKERKKAISKKNKQQAKKTTKPKGRSGKATNHNSTAGKAEANGKADANGNDKAEKPKTNPGFMDIDPNGTDLVKEVVDKKDGRGGALDRAVGFVREMEEHLVHMLDTHLLAFEVAIRRKRYLQALRAVKRAQAIDNRHPGTVYVAVKLWYVMRGKGVQQSLSDMARTFFEADGDVLEKLPPAQYLARYREAGAGSATMRVGAAVVRLRLAPELGTAAQAADELIDAVASSEVEGTGANVVSAEQLKNAVDRMKIDKVAADLVERVKNACREKHPDASCFA